MSSWFLATWIRLEFGTFEVWIPTRPIGDNEDVELPSAKKSTASECVSNQPLLIVGFLNLTLLCSHFWRKNPARELSVAKPLMKGTLQLVISCQPKYELALRAVLKDGSTFPLLIRTEIVLIWAGLEGSPLEL